MKVGRKSKYNKSFVAKAKEFAERGLSDSQISKNLGISYATYFDYQKKYPEFLNAIKEGKKVIDEEVENALLKRATGYKYTETHTEVEINKETGSPIATKMKTIEREISPDTGAIAFWLKNRCPEIWKEMRSTDITTNGEMLTAINVKIVNSKEDLPNKQDVGGA